MSKFTENWRILSHFDRIATVFVIFCSVIVIALGILAIFDIWEGSYLYLPLLCAAITLVMFVQQLRRREKWVALISLTAAVLNLAAFALKLWL